MVLAKQLSSAWHPDVFCNGVRLGSPERYLLVRFVHLVRLDSLPQVSDAVKGMGVIRPRGFHPEPRIDIMAAMARLPHPTMIILVSSMTYAAPPEQLALAARAMVARGA